MKKILAITIPIVGLFLISDQKQISKADSAVASQSQSVKTLRMNNMNNINIEQFKKLRTTRNAQTEFISRFRKDVVDTSSKYNLYGSVMMAQAILESGWGTSTLSTQANNYFGVKGDYHGAFVEMNTLEYDKDGKPYTIKAKFKKYPNIQASLNDNGDKLRNGVSWDANYYSGTWRENTTNYLDATGYLTGRYATSPEYAGMLNRLISEYDLTSVCDWDQITSEVDTNYLAELDQGSRNDGIYRYGPFYTSHSTSSRDDTGSRYNGKRVQVTKTATTKKGQWVFIKLNNQDLGWIDKKALKKFDPILSARTVNYRAQLANQAKRNDGIYKYGPYNTSVETSSRDDSGSRYSNQEVIVKQEKVTKNATWLNVWKGNTNLGWIDSRGFNKFDTVLSNRTVNYHAQFTNQGKRNDGIYKYGPYNTSVATAHRNDSGLRYSNQEVIVKQEMVTVNATWLNVWKGNTNLGWIDSRGFTKFDPILSSKNVNYTARLTNQAKRNDGIYKYGPYNTSVATAHRNDSGSRYSNQSVTVKQEMVTVNATWLNIWKGTTNLGWIDKRGTTI